MLKSGLPAFRGVVCYRITPRRAFSSSRRHLSEEARIIEVAPRDGLQNEQSMVSTETKLELLRRLANTGVRNMEAGAFVSPKHVPQMKDSATVLEQILAHPPKSNHFVSYNFLVPTARHFDLFLQTAATPGSSLMETPPLTSKKRNSSSSLLSTEISVFAAATEAFSHANINCSIAQSLERFRPILAQAKAKKVRARGYVSVALGCPYEGPNVDPGKVAEVTASLLEMGVDEVSVADTTGMGTAPRTRELLKRLSAAGIANHDLALHFHDTYGQALVNAVVGLEHGIRTFDSAVGGLGGCPFAKGATGNVATEDLMYCLHSLGVHTGVDVQEMAEIGAWISQALGREYESRAGKAILARLKE